MCTAAPTCAFTQNGIKFIPVGSRLRERIVRQPGRGGLGFVYLAHDALPGERVAIKERAK
jgi:hypothetical protein